MEFIEKLVNRVRFSPEFNSDEEEIFVHYCAGNRCLLRDLARPLGLSQQEACNIYKFVVSRLQTLETCIRPEIDASFEENALRRSNLKHLLLESHVHKTNQQIVEYRVEIAGGPRQLNLLRGWVSAGGRQVPDQFLVRDGVRLVDQIVRNSAVAKLARRLTPEDLLKFGTCVLVRALKDFDLLSEKQCNGEPCAELNAYCLDMIHSATENLVRSYVRSWFQNFPRSFLEDFSITEKLCITLFCIESLSLKDVGRCICLSEAALVKMFNSMIDRDGGFQT